jgi:hypothetical protein
MDSDRNVYRIVDRDGRLVARVESDHPKRASVMARLACIAAYRRAGITPAMFDTDPAFRIEA